MITLAALILSLLLFGICLYQFAVRKAVQWAVAAFVGVCSVSQAAVRPPGPPRPTIHRPAPAPPPTIHRPAPAPAPKVGAVRPPPKASTQPKKTIVPPKDAKPMPLPRHAVEVKAKEYAAKGQKPLVLGPGTSYRDAAHRVGGRYFVSPSGDFSAATKGHGKLSPAVSERIWRQNKTYIEKALKDGQPIVFSDRPGAARPGGGYSREIAMLRDAVRSSNGKLRYIRADVPTQGGGSRKMIIGVEAAPGAVLGAAS